VASFRDRKATSIQPELDDKHVIQPCDITDKFSKNFQSVCCNPCPVVFPAILSYSEFLSLAPVYDSDIFKAIKHLRPYKSVGVDISSSFFKVCTDIFVPGLKHIYDPILAQ
jgi:hypothetical protein